MQWRARIAAEMPAKVAVWLGLAVGICAPYFSLQRIEWLARREVPVTAVDHWVPFDPSRVGAYALIALLVPLAPLLAVRREELVRYARGLALLCAICFAAFLLFPVAGPRPELIPEAGLYGWIVAYDRPANSMPSLYAGLTAYSLLFVARVLGGPHGASLHPAIGWIGGVWGALIVYSTLATKQHWLVDLPAGALVAYLAYAWAWRREEALVPRARVAPRLD